MTTIAQMVATYPVIDTTPLFLANINTFIGRHIKDYHDPTTVQIQNTSHLIDGLVHQDVQTITAAVSALGLTAYRLDSKPLGVMYRHKDIASWPVVLYWDFSDSALPVFIEDPHNLSDMVYRCTARLQGNNDFFSPRGMISNACARDCTDQPAPGQPNRKASDAAHSWFCLFRRISTWVYQADETIPHVQLHGMVGSPNTHVLIHNEFNSQFTTKYKSICIEMAKAFAEFFPIDECNNIVLATQTMAGQKNGIPYVVGNYEPGKAWFRSPLKGINTCVEARGINGGNAQSVGDEDKGLFAHIELRTANFGQEQNVDRMDKLFKVIRLAVNNFMGATSA